MNGVNEIIETKREMCAGCNRCVRECPMEMANITYQDEAGNIKVRIDHAKCITCGRCVSACKHKAREYTDDITRFLKDLKDGVSVSLIAAPSIRTNIPEYKRLFTFLKRLGVKKIYDVSLGADICIWAHIRWLGDNGGKPMITQPCPAIVSYCEKYRHDLLKYLSPIHSPMACIAVYMKEYEGITDRIAAISPCIAKSNEFVDTGLAQYNVTFSKIREYLEKNYIRLPEEETGFDHYEGGMGSLFPMPGGLKENIKFYYGQDIHVAKAEGFNVYEKLNAYASTPEEILPDIFDVLNCIEGCNIGSACMHDRNIFEIEHAMEKSRKAAMLNREKEYFDAVYKEYDAKFNLSRFMRGYRKIYSPQPKIIGKDVQRAFELLGKDNYEKQNVDCGACGSETCYHMARKIALKLNIPINCIVKAMETAKTEHTQMMMSEQANKAKSAFLSSMSHEMRTPMNAIIGMSKIAAKTSEVDKLKYCLSNIENSSTHLLRLINDILDMSKIEAGKLELDNSPMNLEKMLIRVCNLIIEKIEQKSIKFNILLGKNMRMHYISDELRLSQVITNLLSNALKFTPVGGSIELTAEEVESGENYSRLRIAVKDTGIGMTEEQIERLFNAFEQAEAGTARKFGGTGLGLSISKSIVEKMGGRIWVESVPTKGSKFSFEVKLERPHNQQDGAVIFSSIAPSDVKLLIVDPDAEAREYFKSIVNSFGISTIDEAESAAQAVDLAISAREIHKTYDIVFVDYTLTDEKDVEFMKNSSFKIYGNNVIIMTTFLNWNKVEHALNGIGIYNFIPKPLFPSSILNVINEIIGGTAKSLDITAENAAEEVPDFSNVNLLLAEDVEINREIFISLLEDTGLNIDIAENGLIAVEKFKKNYDKYDMIVMDIQMPEMDGYEATRTIRSFDIEKAKTIPIIAMTANVFKEDIEKCLESGMNDHLSKPIEIDEVIKDITAYCGLKK